LNSAGTGKSGILAVAHLELFFLKEHRRTKPEELKKEKENEP
jgi:hypothetical protein